jgi:RNA methyltransferase, TrmH family
MKLDDIKKLQQKKYRERFGCFVVEGEHCVQELQKAARQTPALLRSELYVTPAYEQWVSPFKTHMLTQRQFSQLADTESPQGILAVVPTGAVHAAAARGNEQTIYLQEVQDPGNLGTILRTLAWFGGFRLLLSPGSVDPFNPKVVRASMGALFHVPLELEVAGAALAARFSRIAVLDLQGESIRSARFPQHDCYVFGNEARGLAGELLQQLQAGCFSIPGSGALESLNLATAVNICAYELAASGPHWSTQGAPPQA